mmetsp:Transcript_39484/g.91673  ORF Transcript_39484/g.91673 Transcript_39484/m.91673 type:complete len:334 (-) Transcript_39484:326-1327(-)
MEMCLELLERGSAIETLKGLRVLFDPFGHSPLHTPVALVAFDYHLAWTRQMVALGMVVSVEVELELLEGGVSPEASIPFGVVGNALGGAPQHALEALVPLLCGPAGELKPRLVHYAAIARNGARLRLGSGRVTMMLVVQECLELIVTRCLREPLVPLGVFNNELVLGQQDVTEARLSRESSVAALEPLRSILLLRDHLAGLGADVLGVKIVLDFDEARIFTQPWVPIGVLDHLLLCEERVGVAVIPRPSSVAILLLLFCLAFRLRGVSRLRSARLRTAPLSAVQDLRVHESLEVGERRTIVEANVPFWVQMPIPHGKSHIGVAAVSVLGGVTI